MNRAQVFRLALKHGSEFRASEQFVIISISALCGRCQRQRCAYAARMLDRNRTGTRVPLRHPLSDVSKTRVPAGSRYSSSSSGMSRRPSATFSSHAGSPRLESRGKSCRRFSCSILAFTLHLLRLFLEPLKRSGKVLGLLLRRFLIRHLRLPVRSSERWDARCGSGLATGRRWSRPAGDCP